MKLKIVTHGETEEIGPRQGEYWRHQTGSLWVFDGSAFWRISSGGRYPFRHEKYELDAFRLFRHLWTRVEAGTVLEVVE